jgi:hypothetical protein
MYQEQTKNANHCYTTSIATIFIVQGNELKKIRVSEVYYYYSYSCKKKKLLQKVYFIFAAELKSASVQEGRI